MHSVSPVRIRTETNLINPMTSINFEEHINNKAKKKTVQIGSSTILNHKPTKTNLRKTTSQKTLATKVIKLPSLRSLKTTKSDTAIQKKINGTKCTTCFEAKSIEPILLNESTSSSEYVQNSFPIWSSCTKRRVSSHSPHKQSNPDLTYTMHSNRSRSYDSLLREEQKCSTQDYYPTNVHLTPLSENLLQKLAETESSVNRIASQLSFLKDYIKHELIRDEFSPVAVAHLEMERNRLLEQLDSFDLVNRDLKAHLYEVNMSQVNCVQDSERSASLSRQIDALEAENHHYKAMISDMQARKCCNHSDEVLNFENCALNNLKQSLEDNRAHLRRQLMAKEADINRLNVQLRNALRKFDRAQIEVEMLKENRHKTVGIEPLKIASATNILQQNANKNNSNSLNNKNKANQSKIVKKYFNLDEILNDPIKTKLYIDKLNIQLIEKDTIIKDLNQQVNSDQRQHTDSDEAQASSSSEQRSERAERYEAEKLRKENDKLKTHLQVKEEKLKNAELKIKNLEKKSSTTSQHSLLSANSTTTNTTSSKSKSKQNNTTSETSNKAAAASNDDLDTNTSGIQRTKNFSEQELNNVRSRLQQRLNELEPLPELLKNTELKLHDALARIKSNDLEISEYKRSINDMKRELEMSQANHDILVQKFKDALSLKSSHQKQKSSRDDEISLRQVESELKRSLVDNLTSTKMEPIERRLRLIEEENRELHRQLSIKEDIIRELSNKLANKTNDASSASRQLDMALTDFNLKEQQLKEKYVSRERSLSQKCIDLDTKLTSLQFQIQHDKRDKEEQSQDYVMQLKDLKARLDQAQTTNKQMQDYVNFLKNSYISYFNENTLHSFESSSNLIGSQNHLF